jgi:diguanylate cyclase (GGDEF)-like protein
VAPTPQPPGPSLHALLELTERALLHGLGVAMTELVTHVAADLPAEAVAVHLTTNGELSLVAVAGAAADDIPDTLPKHETPPRGQSRPILDGERVVGLVTVVSERLSTDAAEGLAVAIGSARRAVVARDTVAAHVDALKEQASVDDLTGALNRRAFFQRLEDELTRSRQRRSDGPVTLVLFDLDHFKAVNDVHGHPAGDAALVAFTSVLESNVRSSDAVGRVGGDEFALLLVGADEADATRVLDRLLKTVEEAADPGLSGVKASHGVARCPQDGSTRDALVVAADRRLYEDKRRRGAVDSEEPL